MAKLAMIALGGNALLRAGQKGTFEEMLENVELACLQFLPLIQDGWNIVIGHGNGPQVGNELLRQEAGRKEFGLEAMPMDFCGAETQGSIAYLLETGLERVLNRNGLKRNIISIVTRVEVSGSDPGFSNPTKPVGPYYKEIPEGESADNYRQDPRGLGWRKVAASPKPLRINNIETVERLAREGNIVITAGGGGIPVVRTEDGMRGVEAVIDKDLASALAAITMKADEFYILTDVPCIYTDFRKSTQKALDTLSVREAKELLQAGQFTEGSMAPKVRAGIMFVENGGKQCHISKTTITP